MHIGTCLKLHILPMMLSINVQKQARPHLYVDGIKNNYRDLEDVHTSYFQISDNYSDQNGVANVSKTASAIISCFK